MEARIFCGLVEKEAEMVEKDWEIGEKERAQTPHSVDHDTTFKAVCSKAGFEECKKCTGKVLLYRDLDDRIVFESARWSIGMVLSRDYKE